MIRAINAITNVNPILLGLTVTVIAGAAWTCWSEWSHAATGYERNEHADFLADCEADMEARRN